MVLRIANVLPCPCCGCSELLDVGAQSAQTMGVECRSCKLTMERSLPPHYPPGCKTLDDVRTLTLNMAIEAWNERA